MKKINDFLLTKKGVILLCLLDLLILFSPPYSGSWSFQWYDYAKWLFTGFTAYYLIELRKEAKRIKS